MGILNYLPTFKVVEMNRSTGLVTGYVLSQYQANAGLTIKTVDTVDFLENGLIVGLGSDLTVSNFDLSVHAQPFIVWNEELLTLFPGLKYYATEEDADGEIYPRAVALMVGDTWTTNYFLGSGGGAFVAGDAFAKVVAGVITLQQAADANTIFAVEESTLPDGTAAVRVTYIGQPLV